MNVPAPTPVTAAAAGAFSAFTWPMLWSRFGVAGSVLDPVLIAGTLLLVALPAHAFVLGLRRPPPPPPGTLDTALLKRMGAWVAAVLVTVVVTAGLPG